MLDVKDVPFDRRHETRTAEAVADAAKNSYALLRPVAFPDPADVAAHVRACATESREKAVGAVLELIRFLGYGGAADAVEGAK